MDVPLSLSTKRHFCERAHTLNDARLCELTVTPDMLRNVRWFLNMHLRPSKQKVIYSFFIKIIIIITTTDILYSILANIFRDNINIIIY